VLELHGFSRHVAVLVVLLALSGCGSSEENEVEPHAAWADGMCVALAKWEASIKSAGSTLKDAETLSKAKVQEAAGTVADANAELASGLKALGKPPAPAADEAKAAVRELSAQLDGTATQIRAAAHKVSTAKDAVQAVSVVSAALLEMSSDITSTLTTLESLNGADEWKQAFADSEACKSLGSS
jgi:methyl-accepting chemotaxis protein